MLILGCTNDATSTAAVSVPIALPAHYSVNELKNLSKKPVKADYSIDCEDDTLTYCKNMERSERIKCLKTNFGHLTKECKASILASGTINQDCTSEIAAHCAEVLPGNHRIKNCLRSLKNISAKCSEVLSLLE